jgi:hypothetical protein
MGVTHADPTAVMPTVKQRASDARDTLDPFMATLHLLYLGEDFKEAKLLLDKVRLSQAAHPPQVRRGLFPPEIEGIRQQLG